MDNKKSKLHAFQNWKKGTIGKAWLFYNQELKGHFEKRNGLYSFVPDWNSNKIGEDGSVFLGCVLEYSPWKKDRKSKRLNRIERKKKLREKLEAQGKKFHSKLQNKKHKKCKCYEKE